MGGVCCEAKQVYGLKVKYGKVSLVVFNPVDCSYRVSDAFSVVIEGSSWHQTAFRGLTK